MPRARTPEPMPASFSDGEKCTLHDGTWPLQELVARLRSEPQRPAPVPIARAAFAAPDAAAEAAPPAARERPDPVAVAAVALKRVPGPAPKTAEQVRPPSQRSPKPRPDSARPSAASGKIEKPAPARPSATSGKIAKPSTARPSAASGAIKKRKRSAERRFVLAPDDADLKRKQADPDNRKRVGRLRAKAEDLVRRRRLREALKVMHQALAIDRHDADNLAYCGWLVFQDSPGSSEESLKLLDRAERTDPRCARTHYYRGMVLKGLGQEADAVMCFERALDLDPDDLQSAREVHLHAQRTAARDQGEGAGLMGWLKKR